MLQDNRTLEEMKKDFEFGKEKEKAIIKYLKKFGKVYAKDDDIWLKPSKYKPDFSIERNGEIIPIEFKYTKVPLKKVQRKANQYIECRKVNGCLLQVSGDRFCLISSLEEGKIIDKGYCNKPCFEFSEIRWYGFDKLKNLFG